MYKMCRKIQSRINEYQIINCSSAIIGYVYRSKRKNQIEIFFFSIWIRFKVLSRLAEKHQALATYAIRALCDFLTEPSPLLYKLYRHTSQKLDGEEHSSFKNEHVKNSKEYRAFQIFEKLRDAAIEGLCKLDFYEIFFFCQLIKISLIYRSLFIRLESDPKCVEALLTQLSARLASGHISDK